MTDLKDGIDTCCIDGCTNIGKWIRGGSSLCVWKVFTCKDHQKLVT